MTRKTQPSSMKSVLNDILQRHHLAQAFESATEFHIRIENDSYLPLVIERHGNKVSVAHYFTQNGDAMRDPELNFQLPGWTPTSITQDPLGHYACVDDLMDSPRRRDKLVSDLTSFAGMWARNLVAQGFTGEGVRVSSLTHPAQPDKAAGSLAPNAIIPAPDEHLEMIYEDRSANDYELYEPSPYDGTFSDQ